MAAAVSRVEGISNNIPATRIPPRRCFMFKDCGAGLCLLFNSNSSSLVAVIRYRTSNLLHINYILLRESRTDCGGGGGP